jgi:hypothetical protein
MDPKKTTIRAGPLRVLSVGMAGIGPLTIPCSNCLCQSPLETVAFTISSELSVQTVGLLRDSE